MEPPSKHRIEVVDETQRRLDGTLVRRAVRAALDQEGASPAEVAVLLATDERVQALNREFRGVDEPTDVLTFPSGDGVGGDLAIAVPYAARQAQRRGVPLPTELAYLAIHGALHLGGLDDATEAEADGWYTDPEHNHRPPELLPRDEVARAINSEVKAGRGTPHGGVFLDIASRRSPEEIRKKLPSMYHQFSELADVDITAEPMEVGPTCHYVMGGIEVDADTAAATNVPGLFASGEVAGGMHGSNRLGGNSLSDLLVFGRRSGEGAAAYVKALRGRYPRITQAQIDQLSAEAIAPFDGKGETAYELHEELQQCMNDLVGIIRKRTEIEDALERLEKLKERAVHVSAAGGRAFNPGWHLALDLHNMLAVCECIARAALIREESRGGHTRDDYPAMSATWRKVNLICAQNAKGDGIDVVEQPMPPMRPDLLQLFKKDELHKYFTDEEIVDVTDELPDAVLEEVEA